MPGNNPDEDPSYEEPNLAIEYAPARPPQPRQPSNLQDLLRYAVEAGAGGRNQAGAPNRLNPLHEENGRFLMDALNSMMINVHEELEKSIKTLKEKPNDEDACIEALDSLSDYVCNIDYANDFLKMGGLPVLQVCFLGNSDEVRWRVAELIGDIAQNNPFSQNFILQKDMFSLLLTSIEQDSNVTVRVKSLYAMSCLVRENEAGIREFIKKDGFSVLLRCIQSKEEKLVIKSCFLISCLSTDNNEVKQVLYSMGIVDQMCLLLDVEEACDTEINEHLLSALASLVTNYPDAQDQCRQGSLNLRFKLNYIKEMHSKKEEYHKEIEYANAILKEVFEDSNTSDEQDIQDR